jgi:Protein of unknown function (DUF497).
MRQVEVEWDEDAIEHIARHQVEPEEVEEILAGRYLLFRGRWRRYYVLGRTEAGRYLFIVLERRERSRFRVVTARDMTNSERKRFRKRVR